MATIQETIEKATDWMESTAKDPKHGYDQTYRWGQKGDYDCSAAVITAWDKAGVDLKNDGEDKTGIWPKKGGANTSWDIGSVLLKHGFKEVLDVHFITGEGLKRGDVLVAKGHHVAMYCGNGKEVEASINEKHTATGGKPGDQTGREFLIRSYRNYPWTNVYRYFGDEKDIKAEKIDKADSKPIENPDYIHFKVTAENGLNVRKKPDGAIITALPKGSHVSFDNDVKSYDGWKAIDKYKIPGGEWKKLNGYCCSKWLKKA